MSKSDSYLINPISGRSIKVGSRRYKDLVNSGVFKEIDNTPYNTENETDDDNIELAEDDSDDIQLADNEYDSDDLPTIPDDSDSNSDSLNYDDLGDDDLQKLLEYADLLKSKSKKKKRKK